MQLSITKYACCLANINSVHFTPCIYLPVSFKRPTQYDNKKRKRGEIITRELRYMRSKYLNNISITINSIYPIYDMYITSVTSNLEFLPILVYLLLYRYRLHFILISSRISSFYTWAGYISSSFSCLPYILCYQHFSMYCLYSLF